MCVLFKVTTQKLYSHGDGAHPASGDDADVTGKNGRVDIVLHVVTIICISNKSLHMMKRNIV